MIFASEEDTATTTTYAKVFMRVKISLLMIPG